MIENIAEVARCVARDGDGAHIVGLSGGKDSTAMALRLAEVEPRPYTFVCTPTGDELPEMLDHWSFLDTILPSKIVRLHSGHTLNSLVSDFNMIPNSRARWCTRKLKIEPYNKVLKSLLNDGAVTTYVGIRADECLREGNRHPTGAKQDFPLQRWDWGLDDVWDYLDSRRVRIPKRTDCGRCFYQRLGEWFEVWRDHPDVFNDAVEQEQAIGHTYRRADRDSWPTDLESLGARFSAGNRPAVSVHPQDVARWKQTDLFGARDEWEDARKSACSECRL